MDEHCNRNVLNDSHSHGHIQGRQRDYSQPPAKSAKICGGFVCKHGHTLAQFHNLPTKPSPLFNPSPSHSEIKTWICYNTLKTYR